MPHSIVKPPRLNAGDTLGLIAPALPVLDSWRPAYEQGKQTLRSLGFTLKEGRTIELQRWWSAGTPFEQAADIHAMFADDAVKGIVAVNGGFSALTVLPHLDFDLIAANPKPLIGMSDITQYQLAIFGRTNQVGFHGNSVINGFGGCFHSAEPAWQKTIQTTYKKLLVDGVPLGDLPSFAPRECWREGSVSGHLIGGNLKRITPLLGTNFFPSLDYFDGAILFWEEIGETLYDMTLHLQQLKLAGALDRISGMIVGELVWVNQYFDEIKHPSPQEAIVDVLQEFDFPILKVGDFGHNMTVLPMPIGLQAQLDATERSIKILEPAVK